MKKKALKAAFPYTLPICIGSLFLGISYGFLSIAGGTILYMVLVQTVFVSKGEALYEYNEHIYGETV